MVDKGEEIEGEQGRTEAGSSSVTGWFWPRLINPAEKGEEGYQPFRTPSPLSLHQRNLWCW